MSLEPKWRLVSAGRKFKGKIGSIRPTEKDKIGVQPIVASD